MTSSRELSSHKAPSELSDAAKMKGKPVKGFPTFFLEKVNGQNVIERTPEGWKSWLAANL